MSEILNKAAETAASAIMRFKAKTAGRYYPGYHEDMRDAVKKAILAERASLSSELDRLREENERLRVIDRCEPVAWTSQYQLDDAKESGLGYLYAGGWKPDKANIPLFSRSDDRDRDQLIGNLLDRWEMTPNDLKEEMREHGCGKQLDALTTATDGTTDRAALSPDNSTQKKEG